MIILGIETSCDETAISVVDARGDLDSPTFEVLGSALHSQVEMHKEFGGVVPMLAKREHIKNLPLVLDQALKNARYSSENTEENKGWNKNPGIDMITVTVGPGLEPALWTGIKFGENLGKSWGIPVIPTNHMFGHVASVLFNTKDKIEFPGLALLISGGHTELITLESWGEMRKMGETVDDAVGEAYDKVARMLGLPYPGGPEISKLAQQAREQGIQLETKFPRPMINTKDYNFSFSGLKTAVLYYLRDNPNTDKIKIAREFEDAITETLVTKTKRAIDEFAPKSLIIGGGVIANNFLRENFLKLGQDLNIKVFIPEKSLTTDNATMIAAAGYLEYLKNGVKQTELKANGNLDI